MRLLRLAPALVVGLALAILGGPVSAAVARAHPHEAATRASGYYVTFVARSCPAYADVFANKARNDVMESLKDLGPNSPYVGSTALIGPQYEDLSPQTGCKPLVGWKFTLGTGYEPGVVTGAWGALGRVTGPYNQDITTGESTPLLDNWGDPVAGGRTIAGATTVRLTAAQASLATWQWGLWVQGGTPTDPVLANTFGSREDPAYGFATLRCADDALNGDNLEYIHMPTGVTHVFCYAYYVTPPPTSGTITIVKKVLGAPAGTRPSFHFTGPLSFDPEGFTLASSESQTFYRGGGQDWRVTEARNDDYKLDSVACRATAPGGGAGSSTHSVAGRELTIHLVAEEHVTCTFTNTWVPPSGALRISKITTGGIGRFSFDVKPDSGSGSATSVTAVTSQPDVPVAAMPSLDDLEPGTWTITEHQPQAAGESWTLTGVSCDAPHTVSGDSVRVTIASGARVSCTFTNAFKATARLSVADITRNGTAQTSYAIAPFSRAVPVPGSGAYVHIAETKQPDVEADAEPRTSADATDAIRLGRYRITQSTPPAPGGGVWILVSVVCNGAEMPFSQGSVTISLAHDAPDVHCVFTNQYLTVRPHDPEIHLPPVSPPTTTPEPPTEPAQPGTTEPGKPGGVEPELPGVILPGGTNPEPSPPGVDRPDRAESATAGQPWADVSVAKHVVGSALDTLGQPVSYQIVVANHGPATAEQVVLNDLPSSRATLVSARTAAGSCAKALPLTCALGNIASGQQVTVAVRLIPQVTGAFVNRATVGSQTDDPDLDNNVAAQSVAVSRPLPKPPFPVVGPGS